MLFYQENSPNLMFYWFRKINIKIIRDRLQISHYFAQILHKFAHIRMMLDAKFAGAEVTVQSCSKEKVFWKYAANLLDNTRTERRFQFSKANFAKLAKMWQKFHSLYTVRLLQDLNKLFFLAFGKIVSKVWNFFSIEHAQWFFLFNF